MEQEIIAKESDGILLIRDLDFWVRPGLTSWSFGQKLCVSVL